MKLVKIMLVLGLFVIAVSCKKNVDGTFGEEFWNGNYFVHKNVNASQLDENIIKAKVDGKWQEFTLKNLPGMFMNWNIKARIGYIEEIKKGQRPNLEGPHNGIVATHGYRREDSQFSVNNAIKGCGFVPKREKIKEIIRKLEDTHEDNFMEKLDILVNLYENADSIFDLNKQVSLELYANPKRGTQTFLNQMSDPISVIVFMAIPTFKLKTISYLLHPENPNLTDYERDVMKYINLIHSYFHGDFNQEFIAVLYNIIEVYNSSPGNENGRGTRIVP